MELMERSLADVVALCEEGLVLQERVIARFTNDVSLPSRSNILCSDASYATDARGIAVLVFA